MSRPNTAKTYLNHRERVHTNKTPSNIRDVAYKHIRQKLPGQQLVSWSSFREILFSSKDYPDKAKEIELPARFQFSDSDWLSFGRQSFLNKSTVSNENMMRMVKQRLIREPIAMYSPCIFKSTSITTNFYQQYLNIVSKLDIVKQMFIAETKRETIICTIIDAPPFEDSLRMPIYNAELEILKTLTDNLLVDFRIHNIKELPKGTKLKHILPPNANLIWQQ